jgi:Bax protein
MQQRFTIGLGLAPLVLVLLVTFLVADEARLHAFPRDELIDLRHSRALEIDTAAELEALFKSMDYHWPPPDQALVPPVVIKRLPGDFPAITQTEQRKSLFLRLLLPIVLLENRRIREQRTLAQWLLKNGLLNETSRGEGSPEHVWLTKLANRLQIKGNLRDPSVQALLLRRLDEIPPALALAQSAIESGWGTSRFALEGNSLFGQWTYQANAGLEPSGRAPDASHLVASFPDLRSSVRAYMRNLNSSRAYREFREAREAMREAGRELSATELAGHLQRYSERGLEYVQELRVIINSSTLAALPGETGAIPPQALLTGTGSTPASVIR